MEELFTEVWEFMKPHIIEYAYYLVGLAAYAVLHSSWLAKQKWIVRVVARKALSPVAVNNDIWDTERIKAENGGKMPPKIGGQLYKAAESAVQVELAGSVVADLATKKEIKKGIERAVEIENRRRREMSRPGTKGGF